MLLPTTDQVQELLNQLTSAWSRGDGKLFGASFTQDAHFVAFDGTVLLGPSAIAGFHQTAFDSHLQSTVLELVVEGTCVIPDSALLVFFQGGIRSKTGDQVVLTGESVSTLVVVSRNGKALGQAFQNTRKRPITDGESAKVWKEFDAAWDQHLVPEK